MMFAPINTLSSGGFLGRGRRSLRPISGISEIGLTHFSSGTPLSAGSHGRLTGQKEAITCRVLSHHP